MANTLSPLSKNQADDLFFEINSLLEATPDRYESNVEIKRPDILPTTENFDKAEVLKCLRILEPNSIIFFQDLKVCVYDNSQRFSLRTENILFKLL